MSDHLVYVTETVDEALSDLAPIAKMKTIRHADDCWNFQE